MESCLYEGRVRHRRWRPIGHEFDFPLCMLYLDLAELPLVFRGRWLWSERRPALARFRREDHLGDPGLPLDRAVRDLVEARSGSRPRGPIRLLTQLRYAGYGFNPVSFYYCFESGSDGLEALVAEVNNTPWGERHCYVLPTAGLPPRNGRLRLRTPKRFHVSPFMGMDMDYAWKIGHPGRRLRLSIASFPRDRDAEGEDPRAAIFDATLALERREITRGALARALARYPLMTAQIAAAIYWQALRLHRKGAPFHSHPHTPEVSLELTT